MNLVRPSSKYGRMLSSDTYGSPAAAPTGTKNLEQLFNLSSLDLGIGKGKAQPINEVYERGRAELGSPYLPSNDNGANMTAPTREEIQAQIAASEARGETKLTRLEGKLDLVLVKLDDVKEDGRHTRNNAILIGVSLALLIIGVVAAAPVIFDLGSKFRETVTKEVQEQVQHAPSKPQQ
jgi:hypothetical protein